MKYLTRIAVLMIGTFVCIAEVSAEVMGRILAQHREETSIAAPTIAISREGARLKITFTGTLQSADAVSGLWNDLPNAASPYYQDVAGTQRFYRTRAPESIFSSSSVVAWTMTGPFQTNFDRAFAGTPDGIFPPVRENHFVFERALPQSPLICSVRDFTARVGLPKLTSSRFGPNRTD